MLFGDPDHVNVDPDHVNVDQDPAFLFMNYFVLQMNFLVSILLKNFVTSNCFYITTTGFRILKNESGFDKKNQKCEHVLGLHLQGNW